MVQLVSEPYSEPMKERASRAFKATKDKIMRLYKGFNSKEPEEPVPSADCQVVEQNEESFNPEELEQSFNRAHRS